MSSYSISFLNIRKQYNDRILFDIPELTVETDKCVLLSGTNGSGKSTLLKILAGLEAPDHATVIHNGRQLDCKSAYQKIHKEIIYLHQTPLMFDASVSDNITYGMRKQNFSKNTMRYKLDAALNWADLDHMKNNNARSLSGGEMQRVALARAYVLSPKILLLDEAFSNMDTEGRHRTFEQICKLKNEGIGIIITSHELARLTSVAEHHLKLENGRLITLTDKNNIESYPFLPDTLFLSRMAQSKA